jgi:uncharacterized protein YjbJ (UPF0337 family)
MKETQRERTEAQQQMGEGLWNQFTGRMKEAWGALTDDDLSRLRGRRDQLIGKIQEKTGEAREVIAEKVEEIAEEIGYKLNRDLSGDGDDRESPHKPLG